MAEDKKNASRLGAALVFLDESGLLMAPLVRRTWAPCGQTPFKEQYKVKSMGDNLEKIK